MLDLKNKNVVVFGLGVSGVSALKLLKALGANITAVNGGDKNLWYKNSKLESILSIENCYNEDEIVKTAILDNCELLILSPGIPRDHIVLNKIHQNKMTIWGEIELGFQVLKSLNELKPIIGITGTNGKTTTTTFMGEMIEAQGKKAFVGGNIGIPFCDMALEVLNGNNPYDFIVLELSSFQLESTVDFRPNIAMILNVFQNHGERYSDIKDYASAKFNITLKMCPDDIFIYPTDFEIINTFAKNLNCKKIGFNTKDFKISYDTKNYKLPGIHNLVNLNFVLQVSEVLNFDKLKIQECIDSFSGVHHRIEYVASPKSYIAYNDAKSTNWDATLTAVIAMEKCPKPLYLIIGGKKRGHGDSILPYLNELKKDVDHFLLIGEMSDEIANEVDGLVSFKNCKTLKIAIDSIDANNFKGTLLFSPAFPSFDQYLNYEKRGEEFISLIQNK